MKMLEKNVIKLLHHGLQVDHAAHVLGSTSNLQKAIIDFIGNDTPLSNGDNTAACSDFDIQLLVNNAEPSDCVSCGHQNGIYCVHKLRFGVDLVKQSRCFTAEDSGTDSASGNTYTRVQQSIARGMVAETDYPSTNKTLTQFYKKIPKTIYAKEDFVSNGYIIRFVPLAVDVNGSANAQDIALAMKFGGLVVSVDGRYIFDAIGRIMAPNDRQDTHVVFLAKQPAGTEDFNTVQDSENAGGFVKFSPNYDFHYPVLILLKKNPMFKLVKGSKPNVFLLCVDSGKVLGIADGADVNGGEMLKAFCGVYANAGIETIPDTQLVVYSWVGNIQEGLFPEPQSLTNLLNS